MNEIMRSEFRKRSLWPNMANNRVGRGRNLVSLMTKQVHLPPSTLCTLEGQLCPPGQDLPFTGGGCSYKSSVAFRFPYRQRRKMAIAGLEAYPRYEILKGSSFHSSAAWLTVGAGLLHTLGYTQEHGSLFMPLEWYWIRKALEGHLRKTH